MDRSIRFANPRTLRMTFSRNKRARALSRGLYFRIFQGDMTCNQKQISALYISDFERIDWYLSSRDPRRSHQLPNVLDTPRFSAQPLVATSLERLVCYIWATMEAIEVSTRTRCFCLALHGPF